jgi:preprotein translocase subunit YajC
MVLAVICLIEALKQYTEKGLGSWQLYLFIVLAAFALFMVMIKRKQRNKAPVRKGDK